MMPLKLGIVMPTKDQQYLLTKGIQISEILKKHGALDTSEVTGLISGFWPDESARLEDWIFSVKQYAEGLLAPRKDLNYCLAVFERKLPRPTRALYAFSVLLDRFGNMWGGSFPDPNILEVKGWHVCIARFTPAGTIQGKSDLHGAPLPLEPKDLGMSEKSAKRDPGFVALQAMFQVFFSPRPITKQMWPGPKK